jgi:DNA-binding CsgD family transcriptional regulator
LRSHTDTIALEQSDHSERLPSVLAGLFGHSPAPPRALQWGAGRSAIIVLGADGCVLEANAHATAILNRRDALLLYDDRVRAVRGADNDTLQNLLEQALDPSGSSGSMLLPRRGGGRDYLIVVVPQARHHEKLSRGATAVSMIVVDPEGLQEPTADWLQLLFGLTAAEARLALRLFAGRTLGEASAELGTSLATLRVHLAHIFRKTRTSRQVELMRLLMSYPWDELAGLGDPLL